MRVAYSKLGRSVLLDPAKWGEVGGDNEPLHMLLQLADRHPDVTWVVAGKHSGDPGDLPPNVEVPERSKDKDEAYEQVASIYEEVDGAVIWLGQHGTSNMPIPQDKDPSLLTNPQEWSRNYAGPIIEGLNRQDQARYEPVWLDADPRNYIKARDLKWYPTHPVLGQFDWQRTQRHYRFGDPRTPSEVGRDAYSVEDNDGFWKSWHLYTYSGLELTGVPPWEKIDWGGFDERVPFGIIINEARNYNPASPKSRSKIMREWVMPLDPSFIYGTWSEKSMELLGEKIDPIHYSELPQQAARARCTLTTPSSGSEWATAKPWEMFALNVVCFFHPYYDTQGHIIPTREQAADLDDATRELVDWLRPPDKEALAARVEAVASSREWYEWLVAMQRHVLATKRELDLGYRLIEQRLGLPEGGST
jgi:hypothetical protein